MSNINLGGSGGSSGLVVGSTTIASGSPGNILYDNSGVLGERPGLQTVAGANLTWWVSTVGSDSNPGTFAQPFGTIQFAVNFAAAFDWGGQFYPTILIEDGTYNFSEVRLPVLTNVYQHFTGGQLVGNINTPANCVLVPTGIAILGNNGPAFWFIGGFEMHIAQFLYAFFLNFGGNYTIDSINFVSLAAIACEACILANFGSTIGFFGGATGGAFHQSISGKWFWFLDFDTDCSLVANVGTTLDFGTSTFLNNIFNCTNRSYMFLDTTPFAGTPTGGQYNVIGYSILSYVGLNRNAWPGTVRGVVDIVSRIVNDIVYAVVVPVTGGTVTTTNGQKSVVLNPAGTLATLTVNLPGWMSDGETFTISTTQQITALTIATTDGSTITTPGPFTLNSPLSIEFRYDLSNNTWYPA